MTNEPLSNSGPYCTAIVNGRRCYAFRVAGTDRCASHNPDSIRARWLRANPGVIARLERERTSLVDRITKLNEQLADIDTQLAARRLATADD